MSDVDEVGVEEAAGDEPVVLAGRHADLLPGDEEALAEEAVVERPPSGRVWSPEPMQAT